MKRKGLLGRKRKIEKTKVREVSLFDSPDYKINFDTKTSEFVYRISVPEKKLKSLV